MAAKNRANSFFEELQKEPRKNERRQAFLSLKERKNFS
jgi:hypothetical protein